MIQVLAYAVTCKSFRSFESCSYILFIGISLTQFLNQAVVLYIRMNDILVDFRLFTNKSMLAITMIEFSTTPCHVGVTTC
jgi:hypothetical protein